MATPRLAEAMREKPSPLENKPTKIGPFMTISRQYGCPGVSLALPLADLLNEEHAIAVGGEWHVFHKEILEYLAAETHQAQEILEREMAHKPSLIADFFRVFTSENVPSGVEIRNRVTVIARHLAIRGRAILIGQGSAAATMDLPHGLAIRLEAPEPWRIRQVARREDMSEYDARAKLHDIDRQRQFLRRLYEIKFPRKPAFHITYDCSALSLSELTQSILHLCRLKGMV